VHSLSRRLLVSVSVPLVAFFGVTVLVFDASFRNLSERSLEALLDAQMVALIAAAEPQENGDFVPLPRALESRLATPGSGLYAQIQSSSGNAPWRSQSTTGTFINFGPALAPGERRLTRATVQGIDIAIASRGIAFEDDVTPGASRHLTFSVAASLTPYEEQLWTFRRRLFGWFVGLMVVLLGALAALLRWVLAPVRRLEKEIYAVEEGNRETLGSGYPRELSGVATNLNALLVGERKRVSRYRDTLGNLAHSLKTPLAVMRSTLSACTPPTNAVMGGEIDRMTGIIEHQLKRAAASGGALLGQAPVEVAPIASELRAALLKVYARKDFSIELAVAPEAQFIGDKGDLTELLGNLLDNACKWCRSLVRLTVELDPDVTARERLIVTVDDDGPGISAENQARVGQRGVRADESVPGHGIGLAMVRDTVDLYGGRFTLDTSELGGASISLTLPGR
jgi:two-component system, OmpR family, sensor histidine kinase PhoQ